MLRFVVACCGWHAISTFAFQAPKSGGFSNNVDGSIGMNAFHATRAGSSSYPHAGCRSPSCRHSDRVSTPQTRLEKPSGERGYGMKLFRWVMMGLVNYLGPGGVVITTTTQASLTSDGYARHVSATHVVLENLYTALNSSPISPPSSHDSSPTPHHEEFNPLLVNPNTSRTIVANICGKGRIVDSCNKGGVVDSCNDDNLRPIITREYHRDLEIQEKTQPRTSSGIDYIKFFNELMVNAELNEPAYSPKNSLLGKIPGVSHLVSALQDTGYFTSTDTVPVSPNSWVPHVLYDIAGGYNRDTIIKQDRVLAEKQLGIRSSSEASEPQKLGDLVFTKVPMLSRIMDQGSVLQNVGADEKRNFDDASPYLNDEDVTMLYIEREGTLDNLLKHSVGDAKEAKKKTYLKILEEKHGYRKQVQKDCATIAKPKRNALVEAFRQENPEIFHRENGCLTLACETEGTQMKVIVNHHFTVQRSEHIVNLFTWIAEVATPLIDSVDGLIESMSGISSYMPSISVPLLSLSTESLPSMPNLGILDSLAYQTSAQNHEHRDKAVVCGADARYKRKRRGIAGQVTKQDREDNCFCSGRCDDAKLQDLDKTPEEKDRDMKPDTNAACLADRPRGPEAAKSGWRNPHPSDKTCRQKEVDKKPPTKLNKVSDSNKRTKQSLLKRNVPICKRDLLGNTIVGIADSAQSNPPEKKESKTKEPAQKKIVDEGDWYGQAQQYGNDVLRTLRDTFSDMEEQIEIGWKEVYYKDHNAVDTKVMYVEMNEIAALKFFTYVKDSIRKDNFNSWLLGETPYLLIDFWLAQKAMAITMAFFVKRSDRGSNGRRSSQQAKSSVTGGITAGRLDELNLTSDDMQCRLSGGNPEWPLQL